MNLNRAFINFCKIGDLQSANRLHLLGADIHFRNEEAFVWACQYGHTDVVNHLYDLGVDINAGKSDGFMNACANNHLLLAKWLRSVNGNILSDYNKIFYNVCANGHVETAEWLCEIYSDIDLSTGFMRACNNGKIELAKMIYSMDRNISYDHKKVFANVCGKGHIEIAKWLYSVNVNVDTINAFVLSYSNGQVDVLKWICEIDKSVVANYMISDVRIWYKDLYDKIFSNQNTVNIIQLLEEDKDIPIIEDIDDIVLYILFKKNRINDLKKINLPYVSYDIENDHITNFVIKKNML